MAASEGVDLEWCIVDHFSPTNITRSKNYSSKIMSQASKCVEHIKKFAGGKQIEAWHSDDANNPTNIAISAEPEPKTDIVLRIGGKVYFTSVKMAGAVQLASGQGKSTAELFRSAARGLSNKRNATVLNSIIDQIEKMPTRLLSESNKGRILSEGKDKIISEFLKNGKIITDKSYDVWLKEHKSKLLPLLLEYIENDKDFLKALLREAVTGEKSLAKFKGAPADSIISPTGFFIVDDAYINKIMPKVKFDIRGKSRSGITGVAFRIDLK